MEEKIFSFIEKEKLFEECNGAVMAVSGGPDSMAMLYFFIRHIDKFGFPFICATLNHKLREEASDEVEMVRQSCIKNNVHFETVSVDIRKECPKGTSEETFSRIKRYEFFNSLREKYNYSHICTAHNLNDNCETILMNIVRGSGLDGLAGIPSLRDDLVARPLLGCKKEEIMEYCYQNNIPFAIDRTNSENIYKRNIVRNKVMPVLLELNPDVYSSFENLSDCVKTDLVYLEEKTDSLIQDSTISNTNFEYDLNILRSAPESLLSRVLRKISLQCVGENLSYKKTKELVYLIRNGKTSDKIEVFNYYFKISYDKLIIVNKDNDGISEEYWEHPLILGKNIVSKANCIITLEEKENYDGKEKNCIRLINESKILLRCRQSGDYIKPQGKEGGKLLKKYYCDLKIPQSDRWQIPIISCKDDRTNIIWVDKIGTNKNYLPEKGEKYLKVEAKYVNK